MKRRRNREVNDRPHPCPLPQEGENLSQSQARSCGLISLHAPLRKVEASVRLDEQPLNAEVIGTTPSYFQVMDLHLQKGRGRF